MTKLIYSVKSGAFMAIDSASNSNLIKNSIPWVIIVILGVISFFIWGIVGLIIGLICGYFIVSALGILLIKASGGILPRDVRINTAKEFYMENAEFVDQRIRSEYKANPCKFVEILLENIYKKAATIGSAAQSGFSLGEARAAYEYVLQTENDGDTRQIMEKLWHYLEQKWYSY